MPVDLGGYRLVLNVSHVAQRQMCVVRGIGRTDQRSETETQLLSRPITRDVDTSGATSAELWDEGALVDPLLRLYLRLLRLDLRRHERQAKVESVSRASRN